MIIGAKNVTDVLKKLPEVTREGLIRGIDRGIHLVQEAAKSECPGGTGELRESIYVDVEEEGNVIRGVCFTDKSYNFYVEFGTGPKGQSNHEGISPNVAVAYTQSPWWIHEGPGEDEIDRATAEYYHFPYIDTPQGRFYRCSGQAAHPFMYPALKNNEDEIVRIVREEVLKRR